MNMRLSEIKISADFESSIPNTYKYNKCENYYNKTGNQDRYIVVDEKNVLVDGYIMYLVLKNHDVEYGNVKRLTLRKHTYTDKQRKKYGRLISPKHVVTYKENQLLMYTENILIVKTIKNTFGDYRKHGDI